MNKEMNINISNGYISFINNGIGFSQFGVAREILDLITNLQEENERLKEERENLTHIVANKIIKDYDIDTPLKNQLIEERSKYIRLSDVCHDYKSRCEKAIEYIKENDYIDLNGYDLLKILGSDEE